jgi:hypothetical protein
VSGGVAPQLKYRTVGLRRVGLGVICYADVAETNARRVDGGVDGGGGDGSELT